MKLTRALTLDLIPFAKKITFSANFWDPSATSAFEFFRQMQSSKLKKKNASFECVMNYHETKSAPVMVAEFSDGSEWKTMTDSLTAFQLRQGFYERAVAAEEKAELANISLEDAPEAKKAPAKGGKK